MEDFVASHASLVTKYLRTKHFLEIENRITVDLRTKHFLEIESEKRLAVIRP
jgi:hypothetical protein